MIQNVDSEPIGHLLAQVCRLEHVRAHELLEELGLHRGQYAVLRALWREDGLTQPELTTRSHVGAATTSKITQGMEEAGLVQHRRDDTDQRVSRVHLTEKGRALEGAAEQIRRRLEAETFLDLSEEEMATLAATFRRMRENLMRVTRSRMEAHPTDAEEAW